MLPSDTDRAGTGNGKFTQWTKDDRLQTSHPVFDLTNYCADRYEKMGREKVNKLYSDHNHTYMPGEQIVAESIVSGLKAFKDSPIIPLLSEQGKALPAADAKYVSDNLPDAPPK